MQTSQHTPFRATVDPSLITSAANFFDNSMPSVIRELLQNSRRSGASRVDIKRAGARWVYSDDGPGCDAKDLLGLGSSRWAEPVKSVESPAGCGFFSLARRNPLVTCPSKGWQVDLFESHFNGELLIEPQDYEPVDGDSNVGLRIEFDSDNSNFLGEVNKAARFMPIDFYIDGQRQDCHQHFMTSDSSGSLGHKFIQYSDTIEIRVDLVPGYNTSGMACYGGLVVDLPETPSFVVATVGGATYTAVGRIVVKRERDLPLELPQRNKMVRSEVTKGIGNLIKFTGLELAAERLKDTCIASPSVWLDARKDGYNGPVLYTKFFGNKVVRNDETDLSTYDIEIESGNEMHRSAGFITFDEFKEGGYRLAPDDDLLSLLAQTTLPRDDDGYVTLDTEEFYAPGLRLAQPLKHLTQGLSGLLKYGDPECDAWLKIVDSCGDCDWYANVTVVTSRRGDNGSELIHEANYGSLDDSTLYDSIKLRFESDDADDPCVLEFEADALFVLGGDSDDHSVDYILTRQWLEGKPSDFDGDLARTMYTVRGCENRYHDDEAWNKIHENVQRSFAKFLGLEAFHRERFIAGAAAAVNDGVGNLNPVPGKVVITLPVSGKWPSVDGDRATCEFIPPYESAYFFEGSYGDIACDKDGVRNLLGGRNPTGGEMHNYPEFHSFDTESMRQLGLPPGNWDIVDACGWHDSTKRIYLTPAIPHVLWSAGLLDAPHYGVDEPVVAAALRVALVEGRVSAHLYSAWYQELPSVVKQAASAVPSVALPMRVNLWVYSTQVCA